MQGVNISSPSAHLRFFSGGKIERNNLKCTLMWEKGKRDRHWKREWKKNFWRFSSGVENVVIDTTHSSPCSLFSFYSQEISHTQLWLAMIFRLLIVWHIIEQGRKKNQILHHQSVREISKKKNGGEGELGNKACKPLAKIFIIIIIKNRTNTNEGETLLTRDPPKNSTKADFFFFFFCKQNIY